MVILKKPRAYYFTQKASQTDTTTNPKLYYTKSNVKVFGPVSLGTLKIRYSAMATYVR